MIVSRRQIRVRSRYETPAAVAARKAQSPGKAVRRPVLSLGDAVEKLARPIAQAIDRATARLPKRHRTKLAGCQACSRRRRWLNLVVPDVASLRAWVTAPARLWSAWRLTRRPARARPAVH